MVRELVHSFNLPHVQREAPLPPRETFPLIIIMIIMITMIMIMIIIMMMNNMIIKIQYL